MCHFWSNFEIADLEFWRGPAYTAFFDYLDKRGGFYYERWGDAPVHSIAAALFAKREQIQFFDEIGEWWFVAADFSWRSVVRRFFFLSGDPATAY